MYWSEFCNFSHTRTTKPITFLGLAALLHVFRFLGPNGILYRSVWHPIWQTLATTKENSHPIGCDRSTCAATNSQCYGLCKCRHTRKTIIRFIFSYFGVNLKKKASNKIYYFKIHTFGPKQILGTEIINISLWFSFNFFSTVVSSNGY